MNAMRQTPENTPKAAIRALQRQFAELCDIGMCGAEAISTFRENPQEKLDVVTECTAQIKTGLSELRKDLEAAKVALSNGEQIPVWEVVVCLWQEVYLRFQARG